jgi:hypothetical protein
VAEETRLISDRARLEFEQRADLMAVARALESEPAILGVSAHILAVGGNDH